MLRWPTPSQVLPATRIWAERQALAHPELIALGVFGSYGRGDAAVGSDLDLLLIDRYATGTQSQRLPKWPLEELPLACDALVLTPEEFVFLLEPPSKPPGRMAQALRADLRWLWVSMANDAIVCSMSLGGTFGRW